MSVFENPRYFEIAFQHRDIGRECDFVESVMELYSKTDNRKVLDVFCGTGAHILELLRRGYEVDGFDMTDPMLDYVREKVSPASYKPRLWKDNLENFKVEGEYGLLTNMLTSFNYITTNEGVLSHLESAAKALSYGGIYIIEMNHPRDILSDATSAPNRWVEVRGDLEIEMDWDYKSAQLDYIDQIYNMTGKMKIREGDKEKLLTSEERIRIFLFQEMRALIALSGWLNLVRAFGAFNFDQALDSSEGSWRMILVLRKE
jgi:SAM-dependent methyltransferase